MKRRLTTSLLVISFCLTIAYPKADIRAENLEILPIPDTSGSTIVTQPFTSFFDSLKLNIGEGNPFFLRILDQARGTGSEVRDIMLDFKKIIEVIEQLANVVFKIFISFLHFLKEIIDKNPL